MEQITKSLEKYICCKDALKEKIDYKITKKSRKFKYKYVGVMALFIAVFGTYYNVEAGSISLDVNPSIKLKLNHFNRIIKVETLNEDAKTLIENLPLKNKSIKETIDIIINAAIKKGYIIHNTENAVLIHTDCTDSNKKEKIEKEVDHYIKEIMNDSGIKSLVISQKLSETGCKNAEIYKISEAKATFIEKIIKENPDLKYEDLKDVPTRVLAKYLKEYTDFFSNKKLN